MAFTRTAAGTNDTGGFFPQSGLYQVTLSGLLKQRTKKDGTKTAPVPNGQRLVACTFPSGFVEYASYNMLENDDGSERPELYEQMTKDGKSTKGLFFEKQLNTLLDSAGIESTDDLEGSTGHVIWQAPVQGATDANGKRIFGRLTVITQADYDKKIASGFVVQPLTGVTAPAGQTDQTPANGAPARKAVVPTPPRRSQAANV